MSLVDQQWSPTSVQVTVLQARGLRIKGKSGTNDAYAVMQVGKEKFQTSVVEKSVAPVWKEEAAFDLPPLLHGAHGSERGTLHVHVLHRALVGPDKLLGQAVINLLQLSEDKTRSKTEWFKLLDKTGKPDKDRGEVLLDIQFMRNNMTASMFDLSAAGKSRSRLGKFKDKVRGKKKESDSGSNTLPSFTQILTDSEEEANGGEVAASKDGKSKKHKMKSLFSPKSNLQKNMSQSMSVLPAKNSTLSGSQSSGLNVDSSEGKKKFKFKIHKRSGSSDSKDPSSGLQKQLPVEQSNLCINGSHVYCEEPPTRTSRIGSNFSLASSGHGSMEEVPENSPPSVDSLRAVRQYSPWTEEEEEEVENVKEDESRREEEEEEKVRRQQEELERLSEEEERRKVEEQRVKREEEERMRREERERLAEEERRLEEQERRKIEEEEEKMRVEEEKAQEERRRRQEEEEERVRREEERKLAEEKRRLEEEERRREEEERRREEERAEEERRQREEEERVRKEKEEYERLMEEKKKLEDEKKRIEAEERRKIMEEERMRKQREEEERVRKEREEYERLMEEKKKLEDEKKRIEAEKRRKMMEEERMRKEEQERKQREEEERVRKEMEEYQRLMEEKRKLEEEKERIEAEEKLRKEEEERMRKEEEERMRKELRRREEEEERVRKEKEEYERLMEEKRKVEDEKKRIEAEERIRKEEEKRMEEETMRKEEQERKRREEEEERVRKEKEEHERLMEEKRKLEEKLRKEEEERIRMEEDRRRKEEEEKRRREEQERIRVEEEKRKREEEERRREEEERARKEKEEYERLEEERMKQEEQRRRIEEEERIRKEEQERIKMEEKRRQEEEERARKEKEEMERLAKEAEERRRIEEEEKVRREERIRRERKEKEEAKRLEKEKLKRDAEEQKKMENKNGQKTAGKKSKLNSSADVSSTNPFDENYSYNPFEEIPDSPPGAREANVQQRCQSAVSSLGSKTVSSDEKELVSAQREKRPAPQPPGRNQAEKLSQREQDASARHLGQINTHNKDKEVKTISVPPQRSVQVIDPISRSPADSKNGESSTQSSTAKGTTGKHSKRYAPPRPRSVEEEPKSTLTAETKHTVYGLNPFEDDEDENDPGSVCWPPAADKDAASQTKTKSSKVAHAPPPPQNNGTVITQNTEGGCVADDTVPDGAANKAHDPKPEAVNPGQVQESPVQNTVEACVKKEGPPVAARRLQPVKPLNSVEQQSVSVVQGENQSTGIHSEARDKAKVNDAGLKGPFSQLTQEELISLVLKQENQLSERDKKISELEQYIDNLLVRVIEEQPSILMSMNSLKKAA
ncbi:trichohyalin [Acanthochromis polyacanthus]|uniref:trichohyalin n=1 Tax=Acanthochromis polyacanthus TaxID=80966 RepID=UPI002234A998|nr:trichohyalin [Acanthochromis polyacanthus]